MNNNDIDGSRPRYLIKQERDVMHGFNDHSNSPGRLDSRMHVKDINLMDNKKKFLYKRTVDPLNPTYKLQDVPFNVSQRIIGPIDG